jgi:hypothetical protein
MYGMTGRGTERRTSPILRIFSLRDFSSNPRSLFSPKRMLSPSNLYVNLCRWSKCCSRAHAIVDYENIRSHDIKPYACPTLPLALSPVNQIVIPFCCRRSTLSSKLTDPGEIVSDRELLFSRARTRMECDICSHY